MAKIITHKRQVSAQGRLNVRRAQGSDFGGGQGLIQAAKAIGDFGDQLELKREKDADAWVNQSLAEYRQTQQGRLSQLEQDAPPGAPNFVESYKKETDAAKDTMLGYDGLTKASKAKLELGLTQSNTALFGRAISFQSSSSAKNNALQTTNALDANMNVSYADANMYQGSLDLGVETIEKASIPADAKSAMLTDYRQGLALRTIQGVISRDPTTALDMLDEPKWRAELSDNAFASLSSSAQTKQSQLQAKALAAQGKIERAAASSVESIRSDATFGAVIDPMRMGLVRQKVKVANNPTISKAFDEVLKFNEWVVDAKGMNVTELTATMDVMPKEGEVMSHLQVLQLKAARNLFSGKAGSANDFARNMVSGLQEVLDAKQPVSVGQAQSLATALEQVTDPKVKRDTVEMLQTFATLNVTKPENFRPQQLQAHLASLIAQSNEDGEVTDYEALGIDNVRTYLDKANKTITEEGAISWAMQSGAVEVPPLEYDSAASWQERAVLARDLQSDYGTEKYQMFLPHEVSELQLAMGDMSATERVQFYNMMSTATGDKASDTFEEIAKKGAPRMSYVAGMSSFGTGQFIQLATEIEAGAKLLEDKSAGVAPPQGKFKTAMDTSLGLSLKNAPENVRAGVIASAEALWAQRHGGTPAGEFDTRSAEAIANEVLGGALVTFNGAKTVLPIGLDEDKFDTMLDNMTQEDVFAAAGGEILDARGVAISPSTLANFSVFEYVGQNSYYVRRRGTQNYIRNADKSIAVLDFSSQMEK